MPPFTDILNHLEPVRDRLVLAGGFAVNHHGYTRNTLDLDFVCAEADGPDVRRKLWDAGYIDIEEGPVALHCRHPETRFRVDVLLVDSGTFLELRDAAVKSQLGEDLWIPTLCLKHLLSMKVHALACQPVVRRDKDLMDIAWLTILNDLSPDEDLKPLCLKYGTEELWNELSDTIQTFRS